MAKYDNEFMKGIEYGRIRTSKSDDLFWVKNVVDDLCYNGVINNDEYVNLLESLERRKQ